MDCEGCKNYVEYAGYQKLTPICKECVDEGYQSNWENIKSKFEPKHKTTNGDRIRAMTDEALAELMHDTTWDGRKTVEDPEAFKAVEEWLEWLKKEVEDG